MANLGYLTLAPDLFWRLKPGVELDPDVESEFKQALDLMGKFNQDQGIRDIEATIREARKHLNRNGKVGRSEEHTYELQSLMRNSYAVYCLKTKKPRTTIKRTIAIYTYSLYT